MLTSLPCLHVGMERLDWDRDADKLAVRRCWFDCSHPERPLGDIVSAGVGCGPTCPGYEPDHTLEGQVHGVIPDLVRPLCVPGAHRVPAFNGSLLKHQGQWLLAYRQGDGVHLAVLDDHWLVRSTRRLALVHERAALRQEDPRLFVWRGRLCVAFTGVERDFTEPRHGLKTSVLYATLEESIDWQPLDVFYPHYEGRTLWEKNWAFFDSGGSLMAVYAIKPHQILRIDGDRATLAYQTETPHAWVGGHLRGGAPPVRVGEEYYHFFHGRIGVGVEAVYNTGVYVFEARPPFRVLRMSRAPVRWAERESRSPDKASVVFVGGAVLDGRTWLLSEGVHDRELHAVWLDKDKVEATMKHSDYRLPDVWCITCQELPQRRKQAAEAHSEANLIPRWWEGIHGPSWGVSTTYTYTMGECPITPGHASLILNHYALWQHLYQSGVQEAIITEDDVLFEPNFAAKASELLRNRPPDAQLIYLGHIGLDDTKRKRVVCPGLAESDVMFGTHCYWVHRTALPVLLERMKGLRSHVDIQLWEQVLSKGHLRWYAADPSLARQGSADGVVPGTLGGGVWPGIPGDLRRTLDYLDRALGGWCPAEKARQMAGLVLMVKPRVVVEIGVYGGKSLLPQAAALRHLHKQGQPRGIIWGIDPWTVDAADEGWEGAEGHKADHRRWWLDKSDLDGQLARTAQVTTELELWPYTRLVGLGSERVADAFTDMPIDILHVDGNHASAVCTRDVRLFVPRVRPGGWVWMDDTGWETTQPAVREMNARCKLVLDCNNWRLYRVEG